MVPAIQVCCEDAINEWKDMASKEGGSFLIDVFQHFEIFTGAVLAQLMFSSKYTQEVKRPFLQLAELAILARLHSKILHIPGEKLKRKSRARDGNRDLLDVLLEELYEGNVTKKSERKKLIEAAIGECKICFFAGFETSSNILTWAMIMLSVHQDWQHRAREEVFQVLGKKDITSDDLGKLKIITMILNEMLRLYPPVMELSRLVEEDTKVNGYFIPKDSLVTLPILMYHRSTEIGGEDAGEFCEAAYMPFGWGPRICPTRTFLAMLLREFSFELSPTYVHAPT